MASALKFLITVFALAYVQNAFAEDSLNPEPSVDLNDEATFVALEVTSPAASTRPPRPSKPTRAPKPKPTKGPRPNRPAGSNGLAPGVRPDGQNPQSVSRPVSRAPNAGRPRPPKPNRPGAALFDTTIGTGLFTPGPSNGHWGRPEGGEAGRPWGPPPPHFGHHGQDQEESFGDDSSRPFSPGPFNSGFRPPRPGQWGQNQGFGGANRPGNNGGSFTRPQWGFTGTPEQGFGGNRPGNHGDSSDAPPHAWFAGTTGQGFGPGNHGGFFTGGPAVQNNFKPQGPQAGTSGTRAPFIQIGQNKPVNKPNNNKPSKPNNQPNKPAIQIGQGFGRTTPTFENHHGPTPTQSFNFQGVHLSTGTPAPPNNKPNIGRPQQGQQKPPQKPGHPTGTSQQPRGGW